MDIQHGRDVLIVVDQQLDFQPGGRLAVPDGDAIVPGINALAARFSDVVVTQDYHPRGHISFAGSYRNRAPYSLITAQDVQDGAVQLSAQAAFTPDELAEYLGRARGGRQVLWPEHCVAGSGGEGLDPRLELWRATVVLRKGRRVAADSYSAFRENDGSSTGLAEMLTARGIERVFVAGLAGDYCVYYTALDAAEAGFSVVYQHNLTRFVNVPEGSAQNCLQALRDVGVVIGGEGG